MLHGRSGNCHIIPVFFYLAELLNKPHKSCLQHATKTPRKLWAIISWRILSYSVWLHVSHNRLLKTLKQHFVASVFVELYYSWVCKLEGRQWVQSLLSLDRAYYYWDLFFFYVLRLLVPNPLDFLCLKLLERLRERERERDRALSACVWMCFGIVLKFMCLLFH